MVLVHGDYWLGNLLIEGKGVAAVVDWSGAHWGAPEEDLVHLVTSLVTARLVPRRDVPALLQRARSAHAEGYASTQPLGR
jgi:aminoglycoside phosphotransferase (APT) family kinase protein